MRAVVFTETGTSDVLHLVDREPVAAGRRRGPCARGPFRGQPDGLEGAPGRDRPGHGVPRDRAQPGRRRASWTRSVRVSAGCTRRPGLGDPGRAPAADGYGAGAVVLPEERVFPLPDAASFDLGASLGVPAVTAHRALTTSEDGPRRLGAGHARAHDRAGAGRGGCGRQRRHPARGLGRRHRDHDREQCRQGSARPGRRRPSRGRLHGRRHRCRDPRARAGWCRHRGRGRSRTEPRARPVGDPAARHDRDLREQRR